MGHRRGQKVEQHAIDNQNTKERRSIARKLAGSYLAHLRSKNHLHLPWNTQKPVEQSQMWPHFLRAAEVVEEMGADPNTYVAAQFRGFRRWHKSRFPFPSQMATDNARLRYIEFAEEQDRKHIGKASVHHLTVSDPFKREEAKLSALAKRYGKSKPEILRLCLHEFTRQFHEKRGSWSDVAEAYEAL